jgi:hypothetical protein
VAIAVGGIVLSKYLVMSLALGDMFSGTMSSEQIVSLFAHEVVGEMQSRGEKVDWPLGQSLDRASQQSDFPPKVWAEARSRFDRLTPEEKSQIDVEFRAAVGSIGTAERFKLLFSGADLLFFGLAALTAFRLASAGRE